MIQYISELPKRLSLFLSGRSVGAGGTSQSAYHRPRNFALVSLIERSVQKSDSPRRIVGR